MESPPSDDGFELVEKDSYDEDPIVYTDDEYQVVEAPVERHAAPPAAHAQPVAGGGGGNQAFPPPDRQTIVGCGQGHHTKTIVQSTSPPGAVAPTRSSPPPPQKGHVQDEMMASPFSLYDVADSPRGLPYDLVDMRGLAELKAAPLAAHGYGAVAAAPPLWSPAAHGADYGEAGQDDEVTDDDDDDYGLYDACYDSADFGRSRHVKRSSGRRGRTKKATTKGRPRGEERSSHIAGKW